MDKSDKLSNSIKNYIKYLTDKDINIELKKKLPSLEKIVMDYEINELKVFYIMIDLFKDINEINQFPEVREKQLTVDYLENHHYGKRLLPFSKNINNSFILALHYFHKQFFDDIKKKSPQNFYVCIIGASNNET